MPNDPSPPVPAISGRYSGFTVTPAPGQGFLDLRIDVDSVLDHVPPLNRVSGDLFTTTGAAIPGASPEDWGTFDDSWVIDTPVVTFTTTEAAVTGTAKVLGPGNVIATVDIRIALHGGVIGDAVVIVTRAAVQTTYRCVRSTRAFRRLTLQVDVCQSLASLQLPEYWTAALECPPGTPARRLTIESAYSEAGLDIVSIQGNVYDDTKRTVATWTVAELQRIFAANAVDARSDVPRWSVWGMLVPGKLNGGDPGLMFDMSDSRPRQGFVLFRRASWFNNLAPVGSPSSPETLDAMRLYLLAWVHEIGHTLNLRHSWDQWRPDAMSWMNRPDNFEMTFPDAGGFWTHFAFQFEREELLHLRHGHRLAVIMGGRGMGAGDRFFHFLDHLLDWFSPHSSEPTSGPLELTLRGGPYFRLMAPVTIEARLRNTLTDMIAVNERVRPDESGLVVLIRRPDGRMIRYTPLTRTTGPYRQRELASTLTAPSGEDRWSSEVDLTYGAGGFSFDAPGDYRIRALYSDANGRIVLSNTLGIRVLAPESVEIERHAADFFRREVGTALHFRGSQAPADRYGIDVVRGLIERLGNTMTAAQLAAAIAPGIASPFHYVDGGVIERAEGDPDLALSLTRQAAERLHRETGKIFNLSHHRMVDDRVAALQMLGDYDTARRELRQLHGDLARRGVRPTVLSNVRREMESLPGA